MPSPLYSPMRKMKWCNGHESWIMGHVGHGSTVWWVTWLMDQERWPISISAVTYCYGSGPWRHSFLSVNAPQHQCSVSPSLTSSTSRWSHLQCHFSGKKLPSIIHPIPKTTAPKPSKRPTYTQSPLPVYHNPRTEVQRKRNGYSQIYQFPFQFFPFPLTWITLQNMCSAQGQTVKFQGRDARSRNAWAANTHCNGATLNSAAVKWSPAD